MRIGEYTREEIRNALAGKNGAEAFAIAKSLSERFDVSIGGIYKMTRDVRLNGRQARSDRGKRKIELSQEIKDFMEGLTRNGDFSGDHAIWVTARHFGLPEDFISVVTYNAWLRDQRISRALLRRDLRPHRSFQAERSNSMHQYDTTVAEAFYANDDGSIGREGSHQRYKNKPGNRRPRLVLYSLIDDFSRVIFGRFYFSENTLNLLDFIFRAWSKKTDPRFPFYGIPDALYCDQGAPRKSAKFKNAEQKLSFKILDTTPSYATEFGSRKHGKVERTFGEGLYGEFMKITRVFSFASLEELNATLWDWTLHINNKASRTTGEIRFARWLRAAGTPRMMPSEEMFKLLHYDRDWRTVTGNLQIDLNGKKFQLPYRKPFINWVGAKIEVYWYPGHEEKISVVHDHYEEEIEALAPIVDIGLQYKSVEKTDREKRLEELNEQKYSAVNFPQIYSPDRDLVYVPRKGEAFDEKQIAEKRVPVSEHEHETRTRPSFASERYLGYIEAASELQDKEFLSRPITAAERAWLRGIFNGRGQISETELNAAVTAAQDCESAKEIGGSATG
jgi:transposase InsO family protein